MNFSRTINERTFSQNGKPFIINRPANAIEPTRQLEVSVCSRLALDDDDGDDIQGQPVSFIVSSGIAAPHMRPRLSTRVTAISRAGMGLLWEVRRESYRDSKLVRHHGHCVHGLCEVRAVTMTITFKFVAVVNVRRNRVVDRFMRPPSSSSTAWGAFTHL